MPELLHLRAAVAAPRPRGAGGGHTGALAAAPAVYERRIVGFFDRALRGGDAQ